MKKKIKQFELGNVYSIETTKGFGLIQLVHIPEDKRMDVEMIRVSYNLYPEIPKNLEEVFAKDFFYVRFPVKSALRKKLIYLVDNLQLDNFEIPNFFRGVHYFNTENWIITNNKDGTFREAETLTPEELLYSPGESVWNDTYLKERLEEGWRLENWT